MNNFKTILTGGLLLFTLLLSACAPAPVGDGATGAQATTAQTTAAADKLVIYSGRNENLVGPLIEQYAAESGVDVEVRYGGTAEMAATILEEGNSSPADLFYGQDAGALGALSRLGRCTELPASITDKVDPRFVSMDGTWVGTSGRARVLAYNTDMYSEADLPASVTELTNPEWQGKVGWAPTNG
ncbi:MAG: extracellular solute-binding protein, partial [Caldilineaceae bacterium]|nr:extracellular solute-binding protein [Caldilineaceae bacterium]